MPAQPTWFRFIPPVTSRFYSWLPVGVFGLLVLLFSGPYLHWFPRGIHSWAQSDRLALAYGFFDHGFDFLHPRTFNLSAIDGVVGVEFPLQSYLTALLGLAVGRDNLSVVFRLLDMLMMAAGCCYLFRLVFETTRNVGTALVPGALLLASPTFVYYAGNYLPDPFSASLLFIAFYYLHRFYYRQRRYRDLVLGLSIAAFATLIKLSTVIYFGSVSVVLFLLSYLYHQLLSVRQKGGFLLLLTVCLLLIAGWAGYMRWLNTTYASTIFLSDLKPLKDKAESDWVVRVVYDNWIAQYLTNSGYWLLRVCVAGMLVYAATHWRRWREFGAYAALLGLAAALLTLFYVLMGPQFAVHDYYIIASAAPLAVLVVLGGILALHQVAGNRAWVQLLGLGVAVLLTVNGLNSYRKRMNVPEDPDERSVWARDGAAWLTRLGVPEQARLLVVGHDDAPNLTLTNMRRSGMVYVDSARHLDGNVVLRMMAARELQYVVMPASYYHQLQAKNPGCLPLFRVLSDEPRRVALVPQQPLQGW